MFKRKSSISLKKCRANDWMRKGDVYSSIYFFLFNRYNELSTSFVHMPLWMKLNVITFCHSTVFGRKNWLHFCFSIYTYSTFSQITNSVEMISYMVSAYIEVNCVKSNETHNSRKSRSYKKTISKIETFTHISMCGLNR
jgi:hypothetical protein